MNDTDAKSRCESRFAAIYGRAASHTAWAPGRLEVLGNHTDYNLGRTLSCAVGLRCYASVAPLDRPEVHLASTAIQDLPEVYPLDQPSAADGHWANYILGIVKTLQDRGFKCQGFAMLIDSDVPGSAGLSSSSALEMSALAAIAAMSKIDLTPIELAKIGQHIESEIVGARTGLLDQLSALLGRRDHLVEINFKTLKTQQYAMPSGWCFVAVDSGVKHDLTGEYNERRASCERAASVMGVANLCDADQDRLVRYRSGMPEDVWRCARHVLNEDDRVRKASAALLRGEIETLGQLMFESHASSKSDFRNSCVELDVLVAYAEKDSRCLGARLSGGGFGGITIHLVRQADAGDYLNDLLRAVKLATGEDRWAVVCRIGDGARLA